MSMYRLRAPRGGFAFLWDLHAVYSTCGMTSYKGRASKWASYQIPTWCEKVRDMRIDHDHYFKSRLAPEA
eukprot:7835854-Pyramimonas_sp.AAC.1